MKRLTIPALLAAALMLLSSCASGSAQVAPSPTPEGTHVKAEPTLRVYVTAEKAVREMPLETYVEGVLAGEMKNDWPMEALKAQAILARTFVLKFIQDKESKYPDADISTDIEEAQAYDASAVNDRIRQAVADTRGLVLKSGGELPYAWFHAHSGGKTDLATVGLGWDEAEPPYTHSTDGMEPQSAEDPQALRDAQNWACSFPFEEMESALRKLGQDVELTDRTVIAIGETGESGRAKTIEVDGQSVDAADLRIALGSTKMRSTWLNSLSLRDSQVYMSGRGYGHGVGMSQWGAYGMAQQGRTANEIVRHYFRDVTVEREW